MDKIKRLILFNIPMTICNFRCNYCYLSQRDECFNNIQAKFSFSPEHVAKALSPQRLGGLAYLNFCADGETLITKNIEKYIYELVKLGHYAEIVTNATITAVIERILDWDKDILKRIEFKCSFHYLELKKHNLLDVFANNVNMIRLMGSSANIEITPCDDMIPFIDEIKKFSIEKFGSLPHITIARNDRTKDIDYLTDLPIKEYDKIWSQFNSNFWDFKKTIFKVKRKEFCYAGEWLLYINLTNGETTQCYCSNYTQNVFENTNKPIDYMPIGTCLDPHCYNGHMLLTLGCIPGLTEVGYGDIRDRQCIDGSNWLQPELKAFFNSKLIESNDEYSYIQKQLLKASIFSKRIIGFIKRKLTNKMIWKKN